MVASAGGVHEDRLTAPLDEVRRRAGGDRRGIRGRRRQVHVPETREQRRRRRSSRCRRSCPRSGRRPSPCRRGCGPVRGPRRSPVAPATQVEGFAELNGTVRDHGLDTGCRGGHAAPRGRPHRVPPAAGGGHRHRRARGMPSLCSTAAPSSLAPTDGGPALRRRGRDGDRQASRGPGRRGRRTRRASRAPVGTTTGSGRAVIERDSRAGRGPAWTASRRHVGRGRCPSGSGWCPACARWVPPPPIGDQAGPSSSWSCGPVDPDPLHVAAVVGDAGRGDRQGPPWPGRTASVWPRRRDGELGGLAAREVRAAHRRVERRASENTYQARHLAEVVVAGHAVGAGGEQRSRGADHGRGLGRAARPTGTCTARAGRARCSGCRSACA